MNSPIEQIFTRMSELGEIPAIYYKNKTWSYRFFLEKIDARLAELKADGVTQGSICAVFGDFSPEVSATLFALMKLKAIIVPVTQDVSTEMNHLLETAGAQFLYSFDKNDSSILKVLTPKEQPPLVTKFVAEKHAGLIVFTSGSTGKPKGILHDCENVMEKFLEKRKGWKTVLFLLMDHFGGFNTFLSCFAYGGMAVCPEDRTPSSIAKVIQESKADLLPTTPTFLNLLFAGKTYTQFDLSSIELITYGTEMMTDTTLKNIAEVFPKANLKQTYGMSELGVLQSKSENKDSLWMKIGGTGFNIKVVENILWVKSRANMIGYINAPNPFDEDGWLCTGDEVEVRGEYIRFMGRKSEIINVGGKKVFPSEVEGVILDFENIKDVTVFASTHPIMGQVVHAKVTTIENVEHRDYIEKLRKFCNERLAKYKVPVKFTITDEDDRHHSNRFKKDRKNNV
ncbi:MAG: class I adenylate-forming enzyme family protein [Bacteriovoracaceae bacterium]